jgi:hypothetical protein
MSRNGAHASPLKPRQELVLAALLTGCTHTEAAAQTGVSRESISRWMRIDRAFQDAYQTRCEGLSLLLGSRIDALATRATRVLREALDQADDPERRIRAALAVFRIANHDQAEPPAAA